MSDRVSRRSLIKNSTAVGLGVMASDAFCSAGETPKSLSGPVNQETCLTQAEDFFTVARGNPKPHTLKGEDLIKAGMTPESWRLEISVDPKDDPPVVRQNATAEKQLSKGDDTALDYQSLIKLGNKKSVKLIKAIQCLNIDRPLGQGLWEGVALRDVLKLCGRIKNVRRIFFWGYHNNKPEQRFQSSLSYTQAVDSAFGDPPVFLAYRLNGKPISPLRGGPVRMIVPWAYGFKSIKWLQNIVLSNDPRANDTYSNQNNDPDSPIKTAAYLDKNAAEKFKSKQAGQFSGVVISGLSGVSKIQFLVRKVDNKDIKLPYDHPDIFKGNWQTGRIVQPLADWESILPRDVQPSELIGFDSLLGQPESWPLRYGMANWTADVGKLKPGLYEFRVRSIDRNGFAQPEPRPLQKSGRNAVPIHFFEVV